MLSLGGYHRLKTLIDAKATCRHYCSGGNMLCLLTFSLLFCISEHMLSNSYALTFCAVFTNNYNKNMIFFRCSIQLEKIYMVISPTTSPLSLYPTHCLAVKDCISVPNSDLPQPQSAFEYSKFSLFSICKQYSPFNYCSWFRAFTI